MDSTIRACKQLVRSQLRNPRDSRNGSRFIWRDDITRKMRPILLRQSAIASLDSLPAIILRRPVQRVPMPFNTPGLTTGSCRVWKHRCECQWRSGNLTLRVPHKPARMPWPKFAHFRASYSYLRSPSATPCRLGHKTHLLKTNPLSSHLFQVHLTRSRLEIPLD